MDQSKTWSQIRMSIEQRVFYPTSTFLSILAYNGYESIDKFFSNFDGILFDHFVDSLPQKHICHSCVITCLMDYLNFVTYHESVVYDADCSLAWTCGEHDGELGECCWALLNSNDRNIFTFIRVRNWQSPSSRNRNILAKRLWFRGVRRQCQNLSD